MKKLMVVCSILVVLVCASPPSYAVELEEGWYAWFGYVTLDGFDMHTGTPVLEVWSPSSSLGQFGSIVVSEEWHSERRVTVAGGTAVAPGVLFEDVGRISGDIEVCYPIVWVNWGTDYDATKMRLQLFRRRTGQGDELVWEQVRSGPQGDDASIWNSSPVLPGDQLVFKVVAVPEPSGLVALAGCTGMLGILLRRRR